MGILAEFEDHEEVVLRPVVVAAAVDSQQVREIVADHSAGHH